MFLIKLGLFSFFITFASSREVNITQLEDEYIKHFGNDPNCSKRWEAAKLWTHEKNATKLRKFCASAHVLSGEDPINVDMAVLRQRVLKFSNVHYHPMQILVAAYGVVDEKRIDILERDYWYTHKPNHWYLTEGQRADCAYLLSLADTNTGQFTLKDNICGIEVPR